MYEPHKIIFCMNQESVKKKPTILTDDELWMKKALYRQIYRAAVT